MPHLNEERPTTEETATSEAPVAPRSHGRDWTGALIGLLVFFGGIGLLALTFSLAYGMFNVPPERALGIDPSQPVELQDAGQRFVGIFFRVLLLIVMAGVGSVIANRGIKLYTESSRKS